jgi:hypothetical protein
MASTRGITWDGSWVENVRIRWLLVSSRWLLAHSCWLNEDSAGLQVHPLFFEGVPPSFKFAVELITIVLSAHLVEGTDRN